MLYRVQIEMDVDADSPEHAARLFEEMMEDPSLMGEGFVCDVWPTGDGSPPAPGAVSTIDTSQIIEAITRFGVAVQTINRLRRRGGYRR